MPPGLGLSGSGGQPPGLSLPLLLGGQWQGRAQAQRGRGVPSTLLDLGVSLVQLFTLHPN